MKVYVIRHGESESNRLEKNCGWSSTPLSETGRSQAEKLGIRAEDLGLEGKTIPEIRHYLQTGSFR